MCGRYHFNYQAVNEMQELLADGSWKMELAVEDRDIRPGDMAPVIVAGGSLTKAGNDPKLQMHRQRWGFPSPDRKGLVFNARSETVFDKPMFRESVSLRRAAVPGTWFYEWNKSKEKYTFKKEGSRVLFFAGFYSLYEDGEHFVILTTEANFSMSPVHDRMPVILEREDVGSWIFDEAKARSILRKSQPQLDRSCEYEQQTLFDLLDTSI